MTVRTSPTAGTLVVVSALLAGLLALLGPSSPAGAQDSDAGGPDHRDGPVLVVLDTSSSMSETWANQSVTGTKIDAARTTITNVVQGLPPGSDFGLIAYPGSGTLDGSGCSRGNEEIAIGPLDQAAAAAAVRRLEPAGDTPTAPALRHAAERLTLQGGYGTIILVSDGESNCGAEEVCDVARDLGQRGVSVQVNTVGLQISESGREELECVAEAGNGRYLSADNDAALTSVIAELAGARLELSAEVPSSMSAVPGLGDGGAVASVAVTASGQYRSDDVRVSIRFDRDGTPGSVTVPRPVIFLGNLEPGATRTVTFVIRPDQRSVGTHRWFVDASASNAAVVGLDGTSTVTADPDELSGILAGVERAIVVGDSYSSGEGTGDYIPGTGGLPGDDNACHRSDVAYGAKLFTAANTDMIACSGAVTAHFYGRQPSKSPLQSSSAPVEPQMQALRRSVMSDSRPTAVLLSIGGNDAGFGDFARQCMADELIRTLAANKHPIPALLAKDVSTCTDITIGGAGLTTYTERITAITNSITRVYRDVDRAVNDDQAMRNRGGRTAPIVVVPYPRIVPNEANKSCQWGIEAKEIKAVNTFLDLLNQVIESAVLTLWLENRPVYFARDVVPSFQPDHTICDADPYALASADIAGTAFGGATSELLHPNAAGHAQMARAIAAWSASASVRPEPTPADAWESSSVRKMTGPSAMLHKTMSRARAYVAGAVARAAAGGFGPLSTVVFYLNSVPFVLGSAEAGEDGTAHADVVVPEGVPPGIHTVVAYGYDESGAPVERRSTVVVGPSGSGVALLGMTLGCVLLVVAGVGFRAARGRRMLMRRPLP